MKRYILQLLPVAIFSLTQVQWPLWCLGWPYHWIQDNDTHWRCCEFTAILSGCPWESMGVRSWHFNNAATREALRALSLNDICINLIHPHIYVSTPQYPYFHPYLHQHHPSTSKSRTFASTSPTFEIMRSQGGRIALLLNDMWINFIHPRIFVLCIQLSKFA